MFKNIDKKFEAIGFNKVFEDKHVVDYERKNEEYSYIQVIEFSHKTSGRHTVSSYQKDVNFDGFNNSVSLTGYEMRLILKKMKKLGWYSK